MKRWKSLGSLVAAAVAAALVAGCGGGGSAGDTGTLQMGLTDAPACGYDHVNVTVQKVRVHQSATASATDAGWAEIVLSPAKRVDLLTLSNGVLLDLGQTALAAGHYTQLQLVLAGNDSANPLANSVTPTGGQETALTTPSAMQTGLKMNVDIDIAANKMADFVLDFDACKSVVHAGASGQYVLKPVVRVVPHYVSGVSGYVDAALAAGTTVSVQQAGVVVKSTAPDSTGKFVLEPVAPGTYDLVVTSAGHASMVVTGVPVTADTVTSLNAAGSPLSAPIALTGSFAGTVSASTSPIDATVDATQTLANGDTVDIAEQAADQTTGAYLITAPAAAPWVAAYAAAPAALAFSADATAGSKYSLQASSGGTTKTAGPISLSAGASVTTNFSF